MRYLKLFFLVFASLFISFIILEITLKLHRKNYSPGAIFSQSMIEKKLKCLKKIKGNKIVFIGGSSVAYGIDCKLVEEKLNLKQIIDEDKILK